MEWCKAPKLTVRKHRLTIQHSQHDPSFNPEVCRTPQHANSNGHYHVFYVVCDEDCWVCAKKVDEAERLIWFHHPDFGEE